VHPLILTTLRRGLAAAAVGALVATPAFADSTPIGALPKGPVTTVTTHRGLLVAVALPHPADRGLVWRLARQVDSMVVREVSEADVGKNVVVVFAVTGKGRASIVYALTRGDSSSKAEGTITHKVRVT
jgi:CO/xanthine dehydrogenase FAD-binding subunit